MFTNAHGESHTIDKLEQPQKSGPLSAGFSAILNHSGMTNYNYKAVEIEKLSAI